MKEKVSSADALVSNGAPEVDRLELDIPKGCPFMLIVWPNGPGSALPLVAAVRDVVGSQLPALVMRLDEQARASTRGQLRSEQEGQRPLVTPVGIVPS